MVASTLPAIRPELRRHEGGYVNHPRDPGGATNIGVTHRTYDAWRRRHGLSPRSVKLMTEAEWQSVVRELFWDPLRCDALPAGLDYVAFDGAWGSGISRGAKWLQRAVGAAQDGRVGPKTVAAAAGVRDKAAAIRAACRYRLGFMQALRIWSTFGRGWTRRVAEVEAFAVGLALAAAGHPTGSIAASAAASRKDAGAAAIRNGSGAAGAAATAGIDATQIDPAQASAGGMWIAVAVLAVALVAAAALAWRSHVNRQRALAYAAAADR